MFDSILPNVTEHMEQLMKMQNGHSMSEWRRKHTMLAYPGPLDTSCNYFTTSKDFNHETLLQMHLLILHLMKLRCDRSNYLPQNEH